MADGFHEVRFPFKLSYQMVGGPGFNTEVRRNPSGYEERVAMRDEYLGEWQVPLHGFTLSDYDEFLAFFVDRRGMGFGFRFFDRLDHEIAATTSGFIGTGNSSDGSSDGERAFQIYKNYTDSRRSYSIKTKTQGSKLYIIEGDCVEDFTADTPVTGETVADIRGDFIEISGATNDNGWHEIDSVSLVSSDTNIVVKETLADSVADGTLYAQGRKTVKKVASYDENGTACSLSVYVDAVLKTVTTDYTVDLNTGVITFNTNKRPQADQLVTVTCKFEKPVRFGKDRLDATKTGINHVTVDMPIIEIKL